MLPASWAITVGEAGKAFSEASRGRASALVHGYGLDESVQMGTVITQQSRARGEGLVG
jgi:malonate-semialdehyde dehydrogenase (acetylating)/methylmalonate-semialdehyde dehydrogenase